jgi:hypothetical protein
MSLAAYSINPPLTAAALAGIKIVSHLSQDIPEAMSSSVQKTIRFGLTLAGVLFSRIRSKEFV